MRVAIIGGGITGLSAAYQLAKRCRESGTAVEIVLYESAGRLGGKVLTRREPGVIMEGGPDSFLVRKPWMRELCVELGLEESLVSFYEGSLPTLMRFRGKLRTVPPGLAAGAPSRWGAVFASDLLSWRGKLRLAAERFVPPAGTAQTRPSPSSPGAGWAGKRRSGRSNRCWPGSTAGKPSG